MIIIAVLLIVVILSSRLRGRLGDGAFDGVLELIVVFCRPLKHDYLVEAKSRVRRIVSAIRKVDFWILHGGRELPSGSQCVLVVKVQ